jgi:sugar/nucleoside kinase (ribokinase family)
MTVSAPAGVLTTGNIVLDILARPVDRVMWGTTAWVDTIEQHMGGNGANTSYALARLGVPSRLESVLGNDPPGDLLLARLNGAGVDTAFVRRSEVPTPATVVLVNLAGERLFLHQPGACSVAFGGPVDFTPSLVAGVSHYHLANVFALPAFRPHAAESLRRAREQGLSVSLDTGWDARGRWLEDVRPCLPHLDLLFVNEDEARMLAGERETANAAAALIRMGARKVVVKRGELGCAVYSAQSSFQAPAFAVEVVDTTGAGDCFVGGYLAAIQRGCSDETAAAFANAVGALAVRQLGAAEALLSWQETEAWMSTRSPATLATRTLP